MKVVLSLLVNFYIYECMESLIETISFAWLPAILMILACVKYFYNLQALLPKYLLILFANKFLVGVLAVLFI